MDKSPSDTPEAPLTGNRKWKRDYRQRRIDAGVCTRCGKVPPEPGYLDCSECKAKLHERNNRWTAKKRDWCRANGICTVCKKRPVQTAVRKEGHTTTCAWCYDKNQEYKAKHKKPSKRSWED